MTKIQHETSPVGDADHVTAEEYESANTSSICNLFPLAAALRFLREIEAWLTSSGAMASLNRMITLRLHHGHPHHHANSVSAAVSGVAK